jgi:hypothetical protein
MTGNLGHEVKNIEYSEIFLIVPQIPGSVGIK